MRTTHREPTSVADVAPADKYTRRGLLLYLVVTFLVSWGSWTIAIQLGGSANDFPTVALFALGGFGPLIGAAVVRYRRRRQPAPTHAVRSRGWRLAWMLPALVMGAGSVGLGALISAALGGPALDLTSCLDVVAESGGWLAFVGLTLVTGPLAEEPGWRGTAYPRLRARMGRLLAMLILGTVWAVWHLPLFFIPDTIQNLWGLNTWEGLFFLLAIYPLTVLTSFAYERAGVAASVMVHFGLNGAITLLSVNAPLTLGMSVAVLTVVASIVLVTSKPKPTAVEQMRMKGVDSERRTQLMR
ncbi:CPBP family intramembrane glutamic endopeptidase [Catenuloplanes sp. NPDC051500]|uniref:CPBP family intramembrane glutamic endopeptidase n=1 Tax=Catenuloplanes sp. NPDC051500 TaxID=3363959 RepID=UPI00379CCDB9